jgi:CRISPR-associated protein Cas7/Csd2, subtype I-C/DVULG
MESLKNKIDFAVVISVTNANPNGDPLNGNRPRTNYDGTGELSDVCIKRKIRNRLMAMGQNVFVQSNDRKQDGYASLRARAEGEIEKAAFKDEKILKAIACEKWIDVRAFGQLFAFKSDSKDGVSIGIRGPVSVQSAFSVKPVSVTSIQITKSVSGEGDGSKRTSDTMGMKHRVDHGIYVFKGAMNPQLASLTGFSDEDARAIKETLATLFEGDSSSARPEGSMEVVKVFWWQHNCPSGQYSSAKVHRTLKVAPKPEVSDPVGIDDYVIRTEDLPGLIPEVIEGR